MKELTEKLLAHLETRIDEIIQAKKEGQKVVGYVPGGYLPEEIVIAARAIPVGLVRGGDHSAVELSSAYICRWFDTFCRAQIGYAISGLDPYYKLLDLLAIPITDNHTRAISDVLDYNTDIEVFPFGVPHMKEESAYKYYLHGINRLKEKVEEITGTEISDASLRDAMVLCNKERDLLKQISVLRTSDPPPLSGKDFVALNHGSFLADKAFMVSLLESVLGKLKEHPVKIRKGPRILLTGSTLAMGDSGVLNLIEEAGANVVMEEFAEGIRPYWGNVPTDSDLLAALAESYFMKRVPPAWFRPGRERLNFLIELAKDFKVDGVIWGYQYNCRPMAIGSHLFKQLIEKETGIPTLSLEMDYYESRSYGAEALRTKVETFAEMLKARKATT